MSILKRWLAAWSLAACASLAAPTLAAEPAGAAKPPNVLIILADDLGWNDVSIHGGRLVETPNIDSIAKDGVRFEQSYAASSICTVSRSGLLTGRDPRRIGVEFNPSTPGFARTLAARGAGGPRQGILRTNVDESRANQLAFGMPTEEVTIAEVLREQGYRTGIFGKWHLGSEEGTRPQDQGFDEQFGMYGGAGLFAPADDAEIDRFPLTWSTIDMYLVENLTYGAIHNGQPVETREYLTDLYANQAAKFIRENSDKPFFAYLSFTAPHTPVEAPKSVTARLAHIEDPLERTYAGMLLSMDEAIGRVLQAIDETGQRDNTLVIFSSDNGGADYLGIADVNAPLRGWKATYLEGGVRVPFFVRWPAQIEPGRVRRNAVVSQLDLLPTLARVAGAPLPKGVTLDGVDISRVLTGDAKPPRDRILAWRADHYHALRWRQWKLMVSDNPKGVWLFDIESDPRETRNLARARPEIVRQMKKMYEAHDSQMREALWPSLIYTPVYFDYTERDTSPPTDAEYVNWPG